MNYTELENNFECACQDVIKDLSKQYKSEYEAGGPGKIEAFFDLIKTQFEKVEANFVEKNKIENDREAIKRIRAIAKSYAKKCVMNYGNLNT